MQLQQTVRAVLALCQLAARCDVDDIRTDILDEAAVLIDVSIGLPAETRTESVAAWCRQTAGWLSRLEGIGGVDEPSLLRAQARVLRLQASADGAQQPQKRIASAVRKKRRTGTPIGEPTKGQVRILEWLRSNPGTRSGELVEHFAGDFSPRTVKRSLSNLVATGLVQRSKTETGGVRYEAAER